jgi:hypothetical protein
MITVKGHIKDSNGAAVSDLDIKVFDFVAGNERVLAQQQSPDQNGKFDIQLQNQRTIPIRIDTIHLVLVERTIKFTTVRDNQDRFNHKNDYKKRTVQGNVNEWIGLALHNLDDIIITVSLLAAGIMHPPITANVADSTLFLYSGTNPPQTGVAPGTILSHRAAVIRGTVMNRDGRPVPGVIITILNHPEFGQTLSRSGGSFDMAVNGGGLLVVDYDLKGHLPVQRHVHAPWLDYVNLEPVVLTPVDSNVTTVDLNGTVPIQIAQGSLAKDTDGTRQCTVLINQGTAASTNGVGLSQLNIRATEYSVGATGHLAMPGPLPPSTGYTYAV